MACPTEVLTAIWGMETGYGANLGGFNLFEALATLAYDGPRAAYGRRQLIAALKIALTEGRDPATMTGSWAGAFGFTQFVPTTFLEQAVDGDGDGKRDLWGSQADALASTANYLSRSGWKSGEPWGEEVQLPPDFPYETADPEIRMAVSEWSAKGVRKLNGEPLTETGAQSAIFLPAGARGPAFLLNENFYAILKYNFATSYALAVSVLSDRLKGAVGHQRKLAARRRRCSAPVSAGRFRKGSRRSATTPAAPTAFSAAARVRPFANIKSRAAFPPMAMPPRRC